MNTTGDRKTGAVIKTGRWQRPALFCAAGTLVLGGLTSCGTTDSVRPSSGASLIDATSMRDTQTRVRRSRVISVNGAGAAGRQAHLAAGVTEVGIRYNWPQGGTQEVKVRYRALQDRKYYVKYAAFPPSVDKLRGTTALSTTAEAFGRAGYRVMEGGMRNRDPFSAAVGAVAGGVVMSPGIVLGTADYFKRVGEDIADKHKAAQWVDIMIISEKQEEGVVRFVRVYPSGKVVWKPWDACSNAPGNAQVGRVLNQGQSAGRPGASGTVFRRNEMAN